MINLGSLYEREEFETRDEEVVKKVVSNVPSYNKALITGYNLYDREDCDDNDLHPTEMTRLDAGISWHLVHSQTREHEFNCEWFAHASAGYGNLDDDTFNELMSMGIDPNDVREFHIPSSK